MTVGQLQKRKNMYIKNHLKYKHQIYHIQKDLEPIGKIFNYKIFDIKDLPALIRIAGFVEIGPMSSMEIDKKISLY